MDWGGGCWRPALRLRAQGYREMVLSTHRSHEAACALYLRNGWQEVEERPVHHYGQPLIELAIGLTL